VSLKAIEKLADDLVTQGVVSKDQLAVAKSTQKSRGGDLSDILISKGFVTEKQLLKVLGKKMGVSVVSLSNYNVSPQTLSLLSANYAKKWNVIPLFEVENKVVVATSDPMNLQALDEIRNVMGRQIDPVIASEEEIRNLIKQVYRGADLVATGTHPVDLEIVKYAIEESGESASLAKLEQAAGGQAVVNTLDNIFYRAYEEKASDIHLEPSRKGLKVRMRIDGALEEVQVLPRPMHMPIVSRIKILAGIDVAERRIPQDGRVRIKVNQKPIDLRINSYPTMFGEAVAVRLLIQERLMTLDDLGFLEKDRKVFESIIKSPHGIFLVTGPTGSGKTTTLYGALQRINSADKHLLSIEDPIEHEIENVDQTQVNVKAGMTFPIALRAMLRQDPDIIMVGEIRDFETADIAIRAAMTGHLVFSTLHTNSAVGAISRLTDLGVEPFLLADTLLGVLAQRLVRRICQHCKHPIPLTESQKSALREKAIGLHAFAGKGCKHCRNTGFQGRIGIFELFLIDDEIRVLIYNKAIEVRFVEKLKTTPTYHSLLDDGIEKIKAGITTVDEVLRVALSKA
jgi:type IV pilus assembly protein PilB